MVRNIGARVLAVTLLLLGSSAATASESSIRAHAASGDWTQYHFNNAHTGYNPYETAIGVANAPSLTETWRYQTGLTSYGVWSTPAVADGAVIFGTTDGHVLSVDAATGALRWSFYTGDHSWISSSPAVVNGIVYIGSDDYWFYALDEATGGLRWRYYTGGEIDSSPAVADGNVFFQSYENGTFWALNAASGAYSWSHQGEYGDNTYPSAGAGVVYAGFQSGLIAFNDVTGAVLWSRPGAGADPTISNGTLFDGYPDGSTHILSAADGSDLGTTSVGIGSPEIANGVLYGYSSDGTLHALSATAPYSEVWTGSGVGGNIALANGVLYRYLPSEDSVIALDASNGSTLWTQGGVTVYTSGPVVSGGRLFVASQNGNVYAFAPAVQLNTAPRVGIGASAYAGIEGGAFAISGSATDSDGDAVSTAWSVMPAAGDVAGATCAVDQPDSLSASLRCNEEGDYTLTLTATDSVNLTATATASIHISDAPLTGMPANVASSRSYIGPVAAFTDANPGAPASDFTASINWGDGAATVAGDVTATANGFAVSGTHTFPSTGTYVVSTTINDSGGSTTTTQDTFTVSGGGGATSCDGVASGGTIAGNVTVPGGGTCSLNNETVSGGITVASGATLDMAGGTVTANIATTGGNLELTGVSVLGNITAGGGGYLVLTNVSVVGNLSIVQVQGLSAEPPDGTPNRICASTFGGNVKVTADTVAIVIGDPLGCGSSGGNGVGGGLTVSNNTVQLPASYSALVSYNTIGGNLSCSGNSPVATGVAGSNNVTGNKKGECAGL